MSAAELRPLGVGEVLDVGIKIWSRNLWTLFRLVVLIVLPVQIASALVEISIPDDATADTASFWGVFAGGVAVVVLGLLSGVLATAACFKAVADAYVGGHADWRTSIRFVSRRVLSVLWVTILGFFVAGLGFLLLMIPGIWLWVSFSVAVPVVLMEGTRGRRALGRSRRLVRGRWWPTFGVLVLGSILTGVAGGVIAGLIGALSAVGVGSDSLAGVTASTIGNTLARGLTTPLTAAFITVLYFDFRVRKEGFDVQLLAERIGLAPGSEGALYPAPPPATERPPAPAAGDAPPFWPPPPGWHPSPGEPERG
jgi:hypothetical protein